ncbi:hypothetical protein G647_10060 [Cladophialophora carrionii CBS 160.54]|uniref:Clr5 domain-containing protein n=1 Tax=Cladophialophora carrionii CBS 160.54 TaxID=1279043 RepID=V9DJV1_9EURO|nr:uncharacterized protein G647_10060 [Cladophialophora carrionii CBS 160.54]ETI26961.1 hypothetical protein G647_10060 [Cladophialophora carrionii CBS 160.54]
MSRLKYTSGNKRYEEWENQSEYSHKRRFCSSLARNLSFVVGPDEWDVSTQRLELVSGSCIQRSDTLLSNATPSPDTISRWEQHKAEIGQLYQHHSLEEVVRLMKERHNFAPSIRSYIQRIAEWGFKKRQATSLTRGAECHE